jgi:hypothetical protein
MDEDDNPHGKGTNIEKSALDEASSHSDPDCFLLADSLVNRGVGKALVCAVGDRCTRRIDKDEFAGITNTKTPL